MAGRSQVRWGVIRDGAGGVGRLGVPLVSCSEVWYLPQEQWEDPEDFKGLWGGGGGCVTSCALCLPCLFNFGF